MKPSMCTNCGQTIRTLSLFAFLSTYSTSCDSSIEALAGQSMAMRANIAFTLPSLVAAIPSLSSFLHDS